MLHCKHIPSYSYIIGGDSRSKTRNRRQAALEPCFPRRVPIESPLSPTPFSLSSLVPTRLTRPRASPFMSSMTRALHFPQHFPSLLGLRSRPKAHFGPVHAQGRVYEQSTVERSPMRRSSPLQPCSSPHPASQGGVEGRTPESVPYPTGKISRLSTPPAPSTTSLAPTLACTTV